MQGKKGASICLYEKDCLLHILACGKEGFPAYMYSTTSTGTPINGGSGSDAGLNCAKDRGTGTGSGFLMRAQLCPDVHKYLEGV